MDEEVTYVIRVVVSDLEQKEFTDYIRGAPAETQQLVTYKALSRLNGNTRKKTSVSKYGEIKFKANALRQIGSSILSSAIPGDSSPLRSPVRSSIYRTLTPGFGGGRRGGSRPGENRAHRCPEGYQYGGRFTDNRFTTCGAQLFAIPSILGAAISAVRRAVSGVATPTITGRIATGEQADSSIIQSRQAQIPRVGNENRQVSSAKAKTLTKEIGSFLSQSSEPTRRMIRRDGFVLEPVVANNVLRAIPDNRDMEGATFMMGVLDSPSIGSEELGLLSNTGVQKLLYVLPGGSTLTLEKARKLSVGERRKLGRVVNSSMEVDNSKDPSARLKNVSQELEGAIAFSENIIGVSDPNSIGKSGKPKWASALLSGKKIKTPKASQDEEEDIDIGRTRKKISNIDNAIQHLENGGTLSDLDPKIIGDVLSKTQAVKRQKINETISIIEDSAGKYFVYENPAKFQHMGEMFASDLQRYLGLPAPEVLPIGKPGEVRQYIRQDVEMTFPDAKFDSSKKFTDLSPEDVARIMISDYLTDQRSRPSTSIYPITSGQELRAALAQNTSSGLVDLSKVQITERMKARLRDFYEAELVPAYSDYYQQLKADQRVLFIKYINQLIRRARTYNPRNSFSGSKNYGMSTGEKIHLNIITKLFESRLDSLSSQKNDIRTILMGGR